MKIFLNSKLYIISYILPSRANKINICQFLTYLNYNVDLVVVEYNGLIINPSLFYKIFLKDYDKIELLSIASGG